MGSTAGMFSPGGGVARYLHMVRLLCALVLPTLVASRAMTTQWVSIVVMGSTAPMAMSYHLMEGATNCLEEKPLCIAACLRHHSKISDQCGDLCQKQYEVCVEKREMKNKDL